MRPLIGLNTSLTDMTDPLRAKAVCHIKYIDAVSGAGGIPVILPPYTDRSMLFDVISRLDGFCLIGGPDYDPRKYGGRPQPADEVMDGRRHTFDIELAEILLNEKNMPVLGVCGGHQLINIALGGALVQDIATDWKSTTSATLTHSDDERKETPLAGNVFRHDVRLAPGSLIARVVGANSVETNSFHHQAVQPDRIGRGLVATGWAPDGVIEAIESSEKPFVLGVQWHPERQTEASPHSSIFKALVDAARQNRP